MAQLKYKVKLTFEWDSDFDIDEWLNFLPSMTKEKAKAEHEQWIKEDEIGYLIWAANNHLPGDYEVKCEIDWEKD